MSLSIKEYTGVLYSSTPVTVVTQVISGYKNWNTTWGEAVKKYKFVTPNIWIYPNSDSTSSPFMIRVSEDDLYKYSTGLLDEEYLPNIKGTISADTYADGIVNGAFYEGSSGNYSGSGKGHGRKHHFDASRYNSIYSDTVPHVRPKTLYVFMWRRVA